MKGPSNFLISEFGVLLISFINLFFVFRFLLFCLLSLLYSSKSFMSSLPIDRIKLISFIVFSSNASLFITLITSFILFSNFINK